MRATANLQELGQSLWLDNITREMLDSGQLQRYVEEFSITGLTSNPSIFDKAIKSGAYDDEIRHKAAEARSLSSRMRRSACGFSERPRRCCWAD